jgi:carboxylesterase type B
VSDSALSAQFVYKGERLFCYFITGVSHADELGYLFHTAISPPVAEDSDEMKVLLKMVKMWTNFAKTG